MTSQAGICALVAAGVYVTALWPSWNALLAASGLHGLAATWAAVAAVRGDWQRMLLLWAGSLVFLVGYPVAVAAFVLDLAAYTHVLPADIQSLTLGLQIGGVGWACWVVGYASLGPFVKDGTAPAPPERYQYGRLVPFVAVGLVGAGVVNLFFFSEEGDALFARTGIIFTACGFVGLVATLCLVEATTRIYRIVGWIALASFALLGVMTGQRFGAVKPGVAAIFFLLMRRRARCQSIRSIVVLAGVAGVVFVLMYPLMTDYKMAMGEVRALSTGYGRIANAAQAFRSASAEEHGGGLGKIMTRVSQVRFAGMIATWGQTEWGWLGGASILESVVMFVPRFLWAEKPTIGLGPMTYRLMGYTGPGCATVPLAADWYINFAWPGTIAGMLAMGRIYGTINRRLGQTHVLRNATLACLVLDLAQAGLGIAGVVQSCMILAPLALLMLPICRTRDVTKARCLENRGANGGSVC